MPLLFSLFRAALSLRFAAKSDILVLKTKRGTYTMADYLIPCLLGLEKLVGDEVKKLGLRDVRVENGASSAGGRTPTRRG